MKNRGVLYTSVPDTPEIDQKISSVILLKRPEYTILVYQAYSPRHLI